jgi:hypothetical protein
VITNRVRYAVSSTPVVGVVSSGKAKNHNGVHVAVLLVPCGSPGAD